MNSTVPDAVCAIRDQIANRIGAPKYRTWFGDAARFDLGERELNIAVANHFVCSWIESNYMSSVTEAAREVLGPEARVGLRVVEQRDPPTTRPRPPEPTAPPPDERGRAARDSRPAREAQLRGDLELFVVGAPNALAYAAAQTVVRSLAREFKPLVLHGGCGLGKTHLLHGIANAVRRQHATLACQYVAGEDFTNDFVSAVRASRVDAFRARFRHLDLLLIDDVHFLSNKRATQDEFLHTFNAIDGVGRQVVLSCDCHPRNLSSFSPPLQNRLVSGMVVKIGAPDFNMRREILRRRASSMNAQLPDDVLDYVARHVTANVRELEGALYKLVALASLGKDRINLDLARVALEEFLARAHSPADVVHVERVAAAFFGCSREMLHSPMRSRNVTLARGIAMYLVRKHSHMSFPEIGRAMGNKNHSTVLMAARRIEKALAANENIQWTGAAGKQTAPLAEVLNRIEHDLTDRRE